MKALRSWPREPTTNFQDPMTRWSSQSFLFLLPFLLSLLRLFLLLCLLVKTYYSYPPPTAVEHRFRVLQLLPASARRPPRLALPLVTKAQVSPTRVPISVSPVSRRLMLWASHLIRGRKGRSGSRSVTGAEKYHLSPLILVNFLAMLLSSPVQARH